MTYHTSIKDSKKITKNIKNNKIQQKTIKKGKEK